MLQRQVMPPHRVSLKVEIARLLFARVLSEPLGHAVWIATIVLGTTLGLTCIDSIADRRAPVVDCDEVHGGPDLVSCEASALVLSLTRRPPGMR